MFKPDYLSRNILNEGEFVGEGVDYLTGVNNTIQCIMQNTIILRSTIHYYTLYDLTGVNKVEINPPACGWIPSTLWCSSSPLVPTSSSRGSLNFFLEGEEVSGAMNQVTLREDAATANWWDNPPHSYKLSKIKVFLCTSLCNGSHKTFCKNFSSKSWQRKDWQWAIERCRLHGQQESHSGGAKDIFITMEFLKSE